MLLAGAALLAAGCGGAAVSSKAADAAPPPEREAELTDEASALSELSRAEGELTALFPVGGQAAEPLPAASAAPVATGTYATAPGSPPTNQSSAPPPGQQPVSLSEAAGSSGDHVQGAPPNPCATACRALASMQRAASHLCGLTGESDDRCSTARDRVHRAEARVTATCGC